MMNNEEVKQAAAHYGKNASFEKLVYPGSTEHNGLRYENVIPWSSDKEEWVKVETRIRARTLAIFEECEIRNLVITQN